MLRLFGRLVGAVVAVCFGVGYAAAYLPPEMFWWTGPFAVILPPVSAVMGLAALVGVVWYGAKRNASRVALAVMVLGLIGIRFGAPSAVWGEETEPTGKALRVMSFNVPMHGPTPAALAEGVAKVVRKADPDLVALQEPWVRVGRSPNARPYRMAPQLERLVGRDGFVFPAVLPPRTSFAHPVLTPSLTLDSLTILALPDALPRNRQQAFAARVPFWWQGRKAVLYNVHLFTVSPEKPWDDEAARSLKEVWMEPSFWAKYVRSYREGMRRRARQARMLRRWMQQETRPVVVAGDFNSTVHNWAYRHVAEGMQNALTRTGWGRTATYPSDRPLVRIDHILASPHWTIGTASVFPESAFSDHRPVVAELYLR